ncbi:MAG: hypothetical protein KKA63_00050 [Gammaproteobacteria bacterium]|nr:hypothetical protein [Gammaproteobacteria bacterium]
MIEEATILRFTIDKYVIDGASLLQAADFDGVVAPYVGKEKDFSDVQYALEAVEALYADRGYSAVHVLLPEQELEAGEVHFQVIEGRYGKVAVKNNQFFSEQNALNAIPSVRPGGVPRARDVARELRLANENPARQLNVVLKAGEQDNEVDASVLVTDMKPSQWALTLDNSGSPETGKSRLGLSYRHANLFDRDHVGQIQTQISPEYMDRVKVLGGSYKVPLYTYGHSVEVFGGYSNINSVVGGLSNFQGGGVILSSRYNIPLERIGTFDPRLSFGLDWRKFSKVELTGTSPTVLYDDIVVTPASVAYAVQGKLWGGDLGMNFSFTANLPVMSKGKSEDFAIYDHVNMSKPDAAYNVFRFGGNYFMTFKSDWQGRGACNGQYSNSELIQGEQLRLGGVDGVRGFSEGSESGKTGMRCNLEGYTPSFDWKESSTRAVFFFDGGLLNQNSKYHGIAGAGFGLRSNYSGQYSLRMDAGRIMNAGSDPQQVKGDWRLHASLVATF